MKASQIISHNKSVSDQILAEEQYQKTLGLMLLKLNLDEISLESLISKYESCLEDKPRRKYLTTFDPDDEYVLTYDPDIDFPREMVKAETISDLEYNNLLWYWECRKVILKALIESKKRTLNTRLDRQFYHKLN